MELFDLDIIQTTTYPSPPSFSISIVNWNDFKEKAYEKTVYSYRNYKGEITLYFAIGNIRYSHEVKSEFIKALITREIYSNSLPFSHILEVLP